MKVLELFAGTRCISQAFERNGHQCFTVEWSKKFDNISLYEDINNLTPEIVYKLCGGKPDVIWASPDCATYSVAALYRHREAPYYLPKSDYAKFCDKTNTHLIKLIKEINPKLYFIENPRGVMRKMPFMEGLPRYTVTYCQYGDIRMKPTDIWTNHPNPNFRPPCKPGMPCHIPAPIGSKTGTQYLPNSRERSKIPDDLCDYIVKISEDYLC